MAGVFTSSFKTISHLIMNISKKQSDRNWNPYGQMDIWSTWVYCTVCFYLLFGELPPKHDVNVKLHSICDFFYIKGAQWDFVGLSCFVCLEQNIFLSRKQKQYCHLLMFFNSFSIPRLSIIRTDHILLTRDSSWSVNWNQYFIIIPKI